MLGRFLSPDPQLQAPDNWLNYNKYAYAMNNPLMYTDPSGEFVEALLITGYINLFTQVATGNIHSIGGFALSFGVGALSGAVGYGVGALIGRALPTATTFGQAVFNGAAIGFSSGFAEGFVSGIGNSWIGGSSFIQGIDDGITQGGLGGLGGFTLGGAVGGFGYFKAKHDFNAIERYIDVKTNPDGSLIPSTETLNEFSDKVFSNFQYRRNANLLYIEGYVESIDENYAAITEGMQKNGVCNVYFSKKSFNSKFSLYLDMGHEYVHVANRVRLGSAFNSKYSEYAAYMWNHELFPPSGKYADVEFKNMANTYLKTKDAQLLEYISIKYQQYTHYGLPTKIPNYIYQ